MTEEEKVAADRNPELKSKFQDEFELFYYDIYKELSKFGKIEELHVCDNLGDHMRGNVYVKYYDEDDAKKAKDGLSGRFYSGQPVLPEFSPVTDFREARCRQFDTDQCNRGGYCNFMHLKQISRELNKELFGTSVRPTDISAERRRERDRERSRSRSRSRDRSRRDRDSEDRHHRHHHHHHHSHSHSRSRPRSRSGSRSKASEK